MGSCEKRAAGGPLAFGRNLDGHRRSCVTVCGTRQGPRIFWAAAEAHQAKTPWTNQRGGWSPLEARPEQPEAPPFLVLDPVIVADRIESGADPSGHPCHHSSAIRSGPSAARHPVRAPAPGEAERRVVGQQPESFDRLRRLEQPDRTRRLCRSRSHPTLPRTRGGSPPQQRRAGGDCHRSPAPPTEARSGMWLSRGSSRESAASPSRLPSRSRSGPCIAIAFRGRAEPAKPICSGGNGSTAKAARITSSIPRPGSTVSSRSLKRRRDGAGRGSDERCRGGSARPGRQRDERRDRAAALPSLPAPDEERDPRRAARLRARDRRDRQSASAKLSRTRRTGASPSGDNGSGRSPSA